MSSKIFGIGVSRTGTYSLKIALEMLGIGPCYHISEAKKWPHLAYQFSQYFSDESLSLREILTPFKAACDVPIFYIWRDLYDQWPDAKFILTIRDSEEWHRSLMESIKVILTGDFHPKQPGDEIAFNLCRNILLRRFLNNDILDTDNVYDAFEKHTALIQQTIPSEQLLVMNINDGWGPLCEFLEVQSIDADFPHLNSCISLKNKYPSQLK